MTTSEERQQMRATAKEGRRAFKDMLADMRNDMALALRFIAKAVLWLAGAAALVFMLFVINQTQPLHAQYAMLAVGLFWVAVLWFHDQARAAAKHREAELRLLGEIHNRLRSLELIAKAYEASPP